MKDDDDTLERRMLGETAIALEACGEKPLTEAAIRTLALVLIAKRLGTIAHALESCRDGDCLSVNAFDAGKV